MIRIQMMTRCAVAACDMIYRFWLPLLHIRRTPDALIGAVWLAGALLGVSIALRGSRLAGAVAFGLASAVLPITRLLGLLFPSIRFAWPPADVTDAAMVILAGFAVLYWLDESSPYSQFSRSAQREFGPSNSGDLAPWDYIN